MINNFKKKFNQKWHMQNFIVICIGLFIFSGLSIGYAVLRQNLDITGEAVLRAEKDIRVTSIENSGSSCGYDIYMLRYNENSITINGHIPSLECELVYTVKIVNNGSAAMELIDINDEIYSNEDIIYKLDGINIGKIFFPYTTTEFTVTFKYDPSLESLPNNLDIGAILEFLW